MTVIGSGETTDCADGMISGFGFEIVGSTTSSLVVAVANRSSRSTSLPSADSKASSVKRPLSPKISEKVVRSKKKF